MRRDYEENEESTDSEDGSKKDEEAVPDEHGFPAVGAVRPQEVGCSLVHVECSRPRGTDTPKIQDLKSVDVSEV